MEFQKVRVRINSELGRSVSNAARGVILEEGLSGPDINEVEVECQFGFGEVWSVTLIPGGCS
jgi:hypothetical protein